MAEPTKPRKKRRLVFPKLVPNPKNGGNARLRKGVKLSIPAQQFVIEKLAQFMTHDDVAQAVSREFGVVIARVTITSYAANHSQQVQLARETYMRELCDTPLAFKRYRLDQLQALYDVAESIEDRLDILKVASAEMRGPDLVAIVLGHRRDEDEATEFLRDPRFQVGSIDVDRILRKRDLLKVPPLPNLPEPASK